GGVGQSETQATAEDVRGDGRLFQRLPVTLLHVRGRPDATTAGEAASSGCSQTPVALSRTAVQPAVADTMYAAESSLTTQAASFSPVANGEIWRPASSGPRRAHPKRTPRRRPLPGCARLRRELLQELLPALLHLLVREVFLSRRDRPPVAFGIDDRAAAIAPELILHVAH